MNSVAGSSPSVLAVRLEERFGDRIVGCIDRDEEVTCEVRPDQLLDVCRTLRDAPGLSFEQLVDLCGVDYSTYGRDDWASSDEIASRGYSRAVEWGEHAERPWDRPRFAVAYHLLSVSRNERLRVRTFLEGDPPRVPSVVEIWRSADWYEREAFDLFGILFDGHPDLRRLLTDYGFVGHPFRKDFPLIGTVEMRYDPDKQRVVYEPVSIEPRTLVPRVIRRDHRYAGREGARAGEGAAPEPEGT